MKSVKKAERENKKLRSIDILNKLNQKKEEARSELDNGDNEAAKIISKEIKRLTIETLNKYRGLTP